MSKHVTFNDFKYLLVEIRHKLYTEYAIPPEHILYYGSDDGHEVVRFEINHKTPDRVNMIYINYDSGLREDKHLNADDERYFTLKKLVTVF